MSRGYHSKRSALGAAMGLALLPGVTHAITTPDAGSILQQVQPSTPVAPTAKPPGFTIEPPSAEPSPASAPFRVQQVQFTGNTAFDSATLQAQIADGVGQALTLAQLDVLAARITDYYRRHGYPLARAIIPPQTIESGTVQITVIEARYGKVKLNNSSRVSDTPLAATLAPLQSGQLITRAPLDRSLLLLSDIPGAVINATLSPGASVGTSDLNISAAPTAAFASNVTLDNYGSRYIGRARLGANLDFNNALHHGDVLSLNGLTSGNRLHYARLAYQVLVCGQGTRVGAAYSTLDYSLGDALEALAANGTARVGSAWLSHPLVRSYRANLTVQMQYERSQLNDRIDTAALQTDRHSGDWSARLSGDTLDTFLSGGATNYSLRYTLGKLDFDNANAATADAAAAKIQGHFSKWNVGLTRLQRVSLQDGVYLSWSMQRASKNLDSSEKLSIGGPYSVRAYNIGALSGDTGTLASLEWRHALAASAYGQWQTLAFLDSGHVFVNRNTWAAGENGATLSGGGVGVNWSGPAQWSAKTVFATRLGATPTLAGSAASTRIWVQVGKGF